MFKVTDDATGDTLVFGELNRTDDGWTFAAIGNTETKKLGTIAQGYGVNIGGAQAAAA